MMILGVAVAMLAGLAAWSFLTSSKGSTLFRRAAESPEDILKQRYAKGEIDDAEFHRRMTTLHPVNSRLSPR